MFKSITFPVHTQKAAPLQKVSLPYYTSPTPPTLKSDFQKKLRVAFSYSNFENRIYKGHTNLYLLSV